MTLGQKLFEEVGKIAGFKVTKVHPLGGVTTEVSFMSYITITFSQSFIVS